MVAAMILSSLLRAGFAGAPQVLWEDAGVLLCRMLRDGTNNSRSAVLVVLPVAERPTPQSVERLEHEYGLKDDLDGAWSAKPLEIVHEGDRTILVLDDPGGESLDRLVGTPMELGSFLILAVGIADALGKVHDRGVIHKDIKPAHVLVDRASGHVHLTGFGVASRLPRERRSADPTGSIAGSLPYMAPEQTGRMNRSIDCRSDLYALGVTLYQMLTGSLPFTASDPVEWVHCHIAKRPVPPDERVPNVPAPVSAIVMKLLSKAAEDRYQTATGLASDLRHCLTEWETRRRVEEFALGARDAPDRLQFPEKLYGRAREVEVLLAIFDRVLGCGAAELALISGYSGIGKSSVVNELHKALVPRRGLFASGKSDQYSRDIPYSTLAKACHNLIRPLLGKSDAELNSWRDAIRAALGPNGGLLVDLIPELKLIIGEQPPVPELPPQQAQSRLHRVFRRLIGVFAKPEHPLTLFLDDLQWLDAATVEWVEELLTRSDTQYLLLVGAYRDNEVDAGHPLTRSLKAIKNAGARVEELNLLPLAREDLGRLIADALRCEWERALPLAQVVEEKTAGNPFFVIQFLHALTEEGLLRFDHDVACWCWDLERIQAKSHTDNVVDLMVGKLVRLPANAQEMLQQLACLGNMAEITTLSIVLGVPEEHIHETLWEAVRHELLERSPGAYRFVHDRVQEAAYSLIPEELRPAAHLRIGRRLVQRTTPEKPDAVIFAIVNQLNRGAALIAAPEEREELAELNLAAALRAKASTAYASALTYLAAGAMLLTEDSWERQHRLAFALALHRAECEILTGELALAEQRLAMLWWRATDLVDLAAIACLRVPLYMTLDRSDHAVAVGLEYLQRVGIDWSPHPGDEEVQREFAEMWRQLGHRPIEALIELPPMTDPKWCGITAVLAELLPPAVFTDRNLHCLVIARMANLSLVHGNSGGSCFAYVWLGMLLGPQFGDYQAGFRFGQLSVDLVEQRGLLGVKARVYLGFAHVVPWTRHLRTGVALVRAAFEAAQETGDLSFANISRGALITDLLATGEPLGAVQREAESALEFARKTRFGLVADVLRGQLSLIRALRGLTPELSRLGDIDVDDRLLEERLGNDPRLAYAGWRYWIRKLQARYYAGHYASAIAAATEAERLLSPSFLAYLEIAEYHFYAALARAAELDAVPSDQRAQWLGLLSGHCRQLESWALGCPQNFENRAALVQAEIAGIEGRDLDAMRLYDQAAASARDSGFVHNEALANELAARFYMARGFAKVATAYLKDARYGYLRWGADGKVAQLERLYPRLLVAEAEQASQAVGASLQQMDVASVVKALQAVSSEIVLPRLIETLMQIALQSAGADRGLLILRRDDAYRIEAEARASGEAPEVAMCEAPLSAPTCPEALLRYVIRTQRSVIVDDATQQNPLYDDDYVQRRHPRSMLCLPLMQQRELAGLLYFENTLASHAFTPDRVAVLGLLSSQAVISLENARLYRALQESRERFQDYAETASDWFWESGPDHVITDISDRFATFGVDRKAVLGKTRWALAADLETETEKWRAHIAVLERHEPFRNFEYRSVDAEGRRRYLSVSGRPIFDGGGRFAGYRGTATDLTRQREAEHQLRHSQKIDAIGQLTGGIAHDFNNILTVISGTIDVLRDEVMDRPDLAGSIEMIERAGARGAGLTRQLLAFARKQSLEPRETEVNAVIIEAVRLLRPTLGEQIEIEAMLDKECWHAMIDSSQLTTALINLALNARDAMPCGGRLTFRTANVVLGWVDAAGDPEMKPGSYVMIGVSDNGLGIPAAIRDKVFEPFFTTKETGRGTGLGLSMVYGFVKQSGGHVRIFSEEGHGTSIKLYLPRSADTGKVEPAMAEEAERGHETILVVEDDPLVRTGVLAQLQSLGYTTLAAADGRQALAILDEGVRFDLLLTDVVMPGDMNGRQLAERIAERGIAVPVLYTSGYPETAIVHEGRVAPGVALLNKPYRKADLARMVRQVLARRGSA
jgi:PAS domain S-box-containing protein